MNNVIIKRGQGGLGRQPLGQDFISGLVFYADIDYAAYNNAVDYYVGNVVTNGGYKWVSLTNFNINHTPAPSSLYWQQVNPTFPFDSIAKLGGVSDALNGGIIPTGSGNYSDETPAVLSTAVTRGATGDTVNIYYLEPFGKTVLLVSYVQKSGDSTSDLLATSIGLAITANTQNNGGYLATDDGAGNVLITLRPGLGIWANTAFATQVTFTYPVNVSATLSLATATKVSSGVASILTPIYYHINRFFTQSPNATLYVGIFDASVTSGYTFPEIATMQTFATGAIRQFGVYVPTAYVSLAQTKGYVTSLQAQAAALITANTPASILLGTDFTGLGAAALTDLSTLNSEHVSLILGHDGANQGASIYYAQGFSVTQLGDVLGLVSFSQVSDNIAWVATYTLSPDGIENSIPALSTTATGVLQLLSTLSSGTIDAVDGFRYIFGRQFANNSPNGTFVNDSHCCTAYTSDYAYIENNRTFDKASRQLYAAYVTQLAAPIVLNADGTLTNASVAFFQGVGENALTNMTQNNPNTGRPELSGYSVTINPSQNVLATSVLVISVKLQPVGVAREIVINLQFAVSL